MQRDPELEGVVPLTNTTIMFEGSYDNIQMDKNCGEPISKMVLVVEGNNALTGIGMRGVQRAEGRRLKRRELGELNQA